MPVSRNMQRISLLKRLRTHGYRYAYNLRHQELLQAVQECNARVQPTQRQRNTILRLEREQADAVEEDQMLVRSSRYLEGVLGIAVPWRRGCADWQRVQSFMDEEAYIRAMDRVVGLAVARFAELEKMNKAGTGTCSES